MEVKQTWRAKRSCNILTRTSVLEDRNAKDTYIKDSNVEILIANGEQQQVSGRKKNTDYTSMIIIALVIVAIGAWGLLTRLGILKPLFS